jgi:hypothetical protein
VLDREVGFNCEQAGERVAFLIGKLPAEAVRVHHGLTLRLRHLTQVAKGACDQPAAILGQSTVLLQRTANLLSLRRSEVFHVLGAFKDAPTLFGGHIVELSEAVAHALLRLWWKIPKAGLIFERPLLLWQRKTAMTIHPLGQMLLIRFSTIHLRPLNLTRSIQSWVSRLTCPAHHGRLSRNHRRCSRQEQGSESWLKDAPQVEFKWHRVQPEEGPAF